MTPHRVNGRGLTPEGSPRIKADIEGDHIDFDRLNNRRSNLRPLPHGGNMQNLPVRISTSIYRGVSWNTKQQKWVAVARVDGKHVHLGYYTDEAEAARVAREVRARTMPYSTN